MQSISASLVGAERRGQGLDETEAGLNALIERRAANREHADDAQAREERWKESERRYNQRKNEALCWEWIRFHEHLAGVHRRIAETNEAKAAALASAVANPGEVNR